MSTIIRFFWGLLFYVPYLAFRYMIAWVWFKIVYFIWYVGGKSVGLEFAMQKAMSHFQDRKRIFDGWE